MPGTMVTGHLNHRPVFKWCSECWPVNQMVIWKLNWTGHLNTKPFKVQTHLCDLDIKIVCHSDPHRISIVANCRHNSNSFQRKLEGTKVTLDSFLDWKAKFDIEFFKAKAIRDPSKPTGREMFINNAALNESDIEFLTNGNSQQRWSFLQAAC